MTRYHKALALYVASALLFLVGCGGRDHEGGHTHAYLGAYDDETLEIDITPSPVMDGKCSVSISGEKDPTGPQWGVVNAHYFSHSDKTHWVSKNPSAAVSYSIVWGAAGNPYSSAVPAISSSAGGDPKSTLGWPQWLKCSVGCYDEFPYDIQVNGNSCLVDHNIGVIVNH